MVATIKFANPRTQKIGSVEIDAMSKKLEAIFEKLTQLQNATYSISDNNVASPASQRQEGEG